MLSIDEARTIQKERSSKALTKFILFVVCDALLILLYFLLIKRFNVKEYAIVSFFTLIILYIQIKRSKVYLFATPKEFTGIVRYYNVISETIKDNLSHLPGDKYRTHECVFGDLVLENRAGKTISKKFVYTEYYGKIKVGDEVTVLRFIERPVI